MTDQAPNALEVLKPIADDVQDRQIISLVKEFPGHTALELARMSGLQNRYKVTRRIDALSRAGYVVSGPPKLCLVSNRTVATWLLPAHSSPYFERRNHGT